ncbi:MAG: copper ion binding protein [Prevotella sp.]|nr:copper ion binding protein [Prevotella sp.]
MKKLILLAAAMLLAITITAANETIVLRIKGMRCEECAHKVTTVLKKLPGIESMNFDLEKRTVTVEYDAALTCTDSIRQRLARTGRYKPTAYSKTDVIHRGIGLQMADMHCQNCVDRITRCLQAMEGIDSLGPHLDKHYFFIRYDANKTSKADIRQALLGLGFTPVNYYTSKDISFAYFDIPKEDCTEATIEEVLAMDGVDDVNVNPKRGTLAITYVNKDTSTEKLLQAVQAAGIKATIPPAHECKENK